MAKKKANDTEDEFEELKEELPAQPDEAFDEDDDSEDGEGDNTLAEDEDDKQMIAKLENEDREIAEKVFAFEEELGFNPLYKWSDEPEKSVDDAQAWLALDPEKLASFKFSKSDVQPKKWLIACACRKNGLHDKFRDITLALISAKKHDPRLLFEDIYLALVDDYAQTGDFDKAFETLEAISKDKTLAISSFTYKRVKALLHFKKGENAEGKSLINDIAYRAFNKDIPDFASDRIEPETEVILFETALSLFALDLYDLGMDYLENSRKLALLNNNNDLILDIHNAKASEEKKHQI